MLALSKLVANAKRCGRIFHFSPPSRQRDKLIKSYCYAVRETARNKTTTHRTAGGATPEMY